MPRGGPSLLQGVMTLLALYNHTDSTTTTISKSPPFDGVVKPAGPGRYDAYLPPPYKTNHASFIEKLPSGDMVMAWFSGTKEGKNDVSIVVSHLVNNVWSKPFVVSRRDGYSNQNPVLFYDEDTNKLHLFHSSQPASKGETHASVWYLVAADGRGLTPEAWSKPVEIFSKAGSFTKNRVLKRLDKTWILPMYYSSKPNYSWIKTLNPGEDPSTASWGDVSYEESNLLVQPTVIRLHPGGSTLISFFRDRNAQHIWWSFSWDDGATWSKCSETSLPNNNAGIHAYALQSGRIAMVYNPQTDSRDPLAVSISEDGGITWPFTRILEHDDGKQEFSYPTMTQTSDGMIHVSYTWKRETIKYSRITEAWIMSKDETPSLLGGSTLNKPRPGPDANVVDE
eukprot:CAMPEP_0197848218 /NCGR_PEP_ID=MMETSP1438-20131217/7991_1 /TAXON_ID=1461541 /ORGANISM="Pterosperma sp., Strain CCMP1384" /LENGTH=394 /DNA_ID=CAMNT_0043460361 /DNA_START=122 /DNA_END=1306 /DNA_ORIENTATION=-